MNKHIHIVGCSHSYWTTLKVSSTLNESYQVIEESKIDQIRQTLLCNILDHCKFSEGKLQNHPIQC